MEKLDIGYGSVDLISIDQIVTRTKRRLQIQGTQHDKDIELYINEAGGSLGSKPTFIKKNCKLHVHNGKAKLPCGFKRFRGIRMLFKDSQPSISPNSNGIFPSSFPVSFEPLYIETNFFGECQQQLSGHEDIPIVNGSIEIDGGYLRFPLPCHFECCILSYEGYATSEDEGGILEMHPAYERGFSEYARAMMLDSFPQLWLPEWGNREITIQRSLQVWVAQREMLVSTAFSDSWERNHYTVQRMLTSLLWDRNNVNIQ